MTHRPAPAAAAQSTRSRRDFGLLWFGEGTSLLGSMTTTLVLPLLAVTQLHAGPFWMGLLSAATWLPWLVLGMHAGAHLDRTDPRRAMIAVDLLSAAVLASVPVAAAVGRLTLPHVALAALTAGTASLVVRLGMGALLPRLVPSERLETANSRIYGTESAAQVAGPGLGGLLVQLVSAAGALVVDALSCLVSAVCLWRITPQPRSRRGGDAPDHAASSDGGVGEGLRVTWADAYLRYTLVTGGLSNFGLAGYQALLVLFLVRELHLSPGGVGLVQAISAFGGLLGAVLAPWLGRRLGSARASVALGVLGGPPALLIPMAAPGWRIGLVPAGALLVGVGIVGANVLRSGFRQRWVPPELLGRVSGASGVVVMGSMPLAGLLAGWAGTAYGLVPTMLAMAGVHVLTALTLLTPLCPFARRRDFPTGPMPR